MGRRADAAAEAAAEAAHPPGPAAPAPAPPPARLPADWPWRERSSAVDAGGLRWHLQRWAPPAPGAGWIVLLHGSGASTHSFAGLAPLLAREHGVLALDLPGHAFTSRPAAREGLSLPGMAAGVAALLRALGIAPGEVAALVGHSAGAAVAARLVLDGAARPRALLAINGAWFPPGGADRWWYAPAARLLALNPLVPSLFAWQASRPATLARLLESTGSRVDARMAACYRHLVADAAHVGAVLQMMAGWDLPPLLAALPRLPVPLHLLVGTHDRTVPPAQAQALLARLPAGLAWLHRLEGLGHLAHEEAPARVAAIVDAALTD